MLQAPNSSHSDQISPLHVTDHYLVSDRLKICIRVTEIHANQSNNYFQ